MFEFINVLAQHFKFTRSNNVFLLEHQTFSELSEVIMILN